MPLTWWRRRANHGGSGGARPPRAKSADADGDSRALTYSEPPEKIRELITLQDYEGALQVLDEDAPKAKEIADPESDYWQVVCLIEVARFEEASRAVEGAIDEHPDCADLYYAQALLLNQQGLATECEEALSLALHYAPASTSILNMLGDIRRMHKDNEGAIAYFSRSLECDFSAETASKLVSIYSESGRLDEAEALVRQGLERVPDNYNLQGNLGRLLMMTDRYEEAIQVQKRLVEVPVLNIQLYRDLTYVHYCLGELDQAKYYLNKILSIEPASYDARYYLGLIQLAQGDFSEAWDNYRWRLIASMEHGRHYAFPEWDGKPTSDTTLLIYAEQGLGDQIMFCGCVPELLARGQRVILECDERLAALFARSFPQARVVPWAKDRKAAWIGEVGRIDCQIAMGDLPGLYRRSQDAFPDHRGYLKPDPEKVAKWRERLGRLQGSCSIGISWRGGTIKSRRSIRSIEPPDWAPLLALPDTDFISLQYGEVRDDLKAFSETHGVTVHHWQEAIDDYDETAALVAALDGVVTVCTAIAHLTGAVGQIGWVATPVIPEWRYMTGGERWLWYPQMALIRQTRIGHWREVMDTIASRASEGCLNAR